VLRRVDALPPAEGDAARSRASARAKGFLTLGLWAMQRGDIAEARTTLTEAVTIERQLSEPFMLALALGLLATASLLIGDPVGMRSAAEESAALFNRGMDEEHWWRAITLPILAHIARDAGDQAAYQHYHDEAHRILAGIDHPMVIPILLQMGVDARMTGDLAEARLYLQDGIKLAQRMKSRLFEAILQSELVHVAWQAGDLRTAKDGYRQMIVRWRDLGSRAVVANQLECLAFVARAEGQPERAVRLLGAADALRELINTPIAKFEHPEYEREMAALRAQMDAEAFAAAWAEGRAMTLEQAVSYAIEQTEQVAPAAA
jgi:hypothetical protein